MGATDSSPVQEKEGDACGKTPTLRFPAIFRLGLIAGSVKFYAGVNRPLWGDGIRYGQRGPHAVVERGEPPALQGPPAHVGMA